MTEQYNKAVRATKGMSTEDLTKLKNYVSALLAQGPVSSDRVVTSLSHDDWILQGLAEYIRSAGMPPVKIETMLQASQYATFKDKSEGVKQYLTRVGDKNAQRALLRVGFKLMHKRMSELRISISYLTFMGWIHRLPGSVNREFPGYMEAGLLHLIIRGETNVRPKQSKRPVQRKREKTASE
jgi:hypothetical protein